MNLNNSQPPTPPENSSEPSDAEFLSRLMRTARSAQLDSGFSTRLRDQLLHGPVVPTTRSRRAYQAALSFTSATALLMLILFSSVVWPMVTQPARTTNVPVLDNNFRGALATNAEFNPLIETEHARTANSTDAPASEMVEISTVAAQAVPAPPAAPSPAGTPAPQSTTQP